MKNEETGEFELVLGNKQLLSGFFVVVVLFAVFFLMGYFVGRNSSPPVRAANPPATTAAQASTPDSRPDASGPAPAQTAPAKQEPADNSPADATSGTRPAQTSPAQTATPPAAAPAPVEPAPGESYLQVMAVRQEEAEIVARTLKDKGFPSSLSPASKGLTRVLVGPYTDTASLGKAKAELENAGFHPIVKK